MSEQREFEVRGDTLWQLVRAEEHGLSWRPVGEVRRLVHAANCFPALLAALKGFMAVWPEAERAINGACAISQVHGVPYSGPSLVPELDAMRAAIATADPSTGDSE